MTRLLLMAATALLMTSNVNAEKVFQYDEQLIIGQDDILNTFPLSFGPEGFTRILGWNDAQIEEFRLAAIDWFLVRFGIDFRNAPFVPLKGGWYNGFATLAPLSFEGKYRVEESTTCTVGPITNGHPTRVQLCEFVATFDAGAGFEFAGTYAPQGVPGDPSANLAFGCYLVGGEFHFFMKSTVPASVDASGRSREVLLLFSPTFKQGLSIMNVGTFFPNPEGKFPTYIHALWSFPGSNVVPDYNVYTSSPVTFPVEP